MSDTVQLIVTLSKGQYEHLKNIQYGGIAARIIFNAVKNGIPLEDVKAEIDKQEFAHHQGLTHWYMTPSEVKSVVFEILDNIGKAESEDKE